MQYGLTRIPSKPEQFLDLIFLQPGADNHDTAGIIGSSGSDLGFLGNHVKVNPGSVRARYHTF